MVRTSKDLSVVMTTFNRPVLLAQALNSLVAANQKALSWELIVVDNDSTDNTLDLLEGYRDHLPLKIYREARRGYAKAKNRGLTEASGQVVVFTDDDIIADPEWLRTLHAAALRWPDADVFGGRIQPLLPNPLPRWLQNETMRNRMTKMFGYYNPRPEEGPTNRPPVGVNLAFRASAAEGMRLDENRGADGSENYIQSAEIDFIRRMISAGPQIIFVPDAVVRHVVRPEQLTLKSLGARAFRRGRNSAVRDTARYAEGRRISGAPAGLWLTIVKLQLKAWTLAPLGKRVRYLVKDKLAFKRGALYQLRMQHRQADPKENSSTIASK